MLKQVIFSGFGGQGVLLAGQLLAMAGMLEGRHVTWYPSYGAEMRGGTANCTVMVADHKIGSPVASQADLLMALNQPALDVFTKKVASGGELIYNSSVTTNPPVRDDISAKGIPATELASQIGDTRVVNMIMLGALISATKLIDSSSVLEALAKKLGPSKKGLIPVNQQALDMGSKAYTQGYH